MNMVNWSSHHLPFTLRYYVKTNSSPSGWEGREGGRRRENHSSQLSCENKHAIVPYGKVKCRWTPSISGDREEICSPHCSFWAWEDPFWLPSDFKCKRLKGRCHVASYGLDYTPGSNLHAENSAAGACTPTLAEPCRAPLCIFQVFWRSAVVPH